MPPRRRLVEIGMWSDEAEALVDLIVDRIGTMKAVDREDLMALRRMTEARCSLERALGRNA